MTTNPTTAPADPRVSIVIPSFNTRDVLRDCLQALAAERAHIAMEVVVVENGSKDDSAAMVAREFPWVVLVALPENLGFSGGLNCGFSRARAPICIALNSDARVHPGALNALCEALDTNADAGAACPRCLNPDGSIQSMGDRTHSLIELVRVGTGFGKRRLPWTERDPEHSERVPAPSGACLAFSRRGLEALRGLDEGLKLYLEEEDIARRLEAAGLSTYYVAQARVTHLVGVSTRTIDPEWIVLARHQTLAHFLRKHYPGLDGLAARVAIAMVQGATMLKNVVELVVPGRFVASRRRLATKAAAIATYLRPG